jgi:hypothetical protein
VELEKPRTPAQNRSLHLWFTKLANQLNESGMTVMRVMKHDAEIPWTEHMVKEMLFKTIMKSMYGKTSTTQLTTKELTLVSDTLIRYLAEKNYVETEFPSLETQIMNDRTKG